MPSLPQTPVKYRRALTLIELLAAMGIVGILTAILIPAIGSARVNSQTAKCIGHLRSWGVATQLYIADNEGKFPVSHYRGANTSTQLAPYLSVSASLTPSELNKLMGCTAENWQYGFNAYLSEQNHLVVSQPARHIWAMDLSQQVNSNRWIDATVLGSKVTALREATPKPHNKRVNVLYVSGNVETKKVSELFRAEVNRDFSGYTVMDETTPIGNPAYDR